MCDIVKKGRWATAKRFKKGDRVSVRSTLFDLVEGGERCYSSTLPGNPKKLYGVVTDVFTATARVKWFYDGQTSTELFEVLTLETPESIPEETTEMIQTVCEAFL